MKRSMFLGTAGAAVLAGCGAHHANAFLPATAAAHSSVPGPNVALKLVPQVPDAIPANVLAHPIVGEAWRFEGAAIPAGWLKMDGSVLSISDHKALFAVLGDVPGAKSASGTFTLAKPGYGVIIAADGAQPSSPTSLARASRTFARPASGMPAPRPTPPPTAAQTNQREADALYAQISNEPGAAVSGALADRIARTGRDARSQCAVVLGETSAQALAGAIAASVAGRATLAHGVEEVAWRLTSGEVSAVLAAANARQEAFGSARITGGAHEAAAFLMEVSISPEQAEAISQRES